MRRRHRLPRQRRPRSPAAAAGATPSPARRRARRRRSPARGRRRPSRSTRRRSRSSTAPWAMTFLPDGRMLVTEKAGQLLLVSADGKRGTTVAAIAAGRQRRAGRADGRRARTPTSRENGCVYLSYSAAGAGGKGVVLARGTLDRARRRRAARRASQTIFRADAAASRATAIIRAASPSRPTAISVLHQWRAAEVRPGAGPEGDARQGAAADARRHARRRAIRSPPRASIRRSGATATATCSASPSTRRASCGSRRWGRRAATRST